MKKNIFLGMKKKGLKKLFVGNQSAPSRYYRKCQIQMFSLCVREWDRFLRYNDISNRLLFKISKVSNKSLKSSSTVEHTTVVWINWIKKKSSKWKAIVGRNFLICFHSVIFLRWAKDLHLIWSFQTKTREKKLHSTFVIHCQFYYFEL